MDSEKENGKTTTTKVEDEAEEAVVVVATTVDSGSSSCPPPQSSADKKTKPKKKPTRQPQRKSARIHKSQSCISTQKLIRMKQLFWSSSTVSPHQKKRPRTTTDNNNNNNATTTDNTTTLRMTGLILEKVHDSPNIYIIDNFLRDSELLYLESLIMEASSTKSTTRKKKQEKQQGDETITTSGTTTTTATTTNSVKKSSTTTSSTKPRIKFQKSYVDLHEGDDDHNDNQRRNSTSSSSSIVLNDQRTSTFLSLPKLGTAPIAAIEIRAADLLGISIEQMEPLQLVRYKSGQFFGIHHDLGSYIENDEDEDIIVTLPKRTCFVRRRIATIFCYINTLPVDAGGATYFPQAHDLRIIPKRGRAVLFCNITQNGYPDPKTIHAGEVMKSLQHIKYGLNIWACEE